MKRDRNYGFGPEEASLNGPKRVLFGLTFFIIVLVSVVCYSCNGNTTTHNTTCNVKHKVKNVNSLGRFPYSETDKLSIVEIDGCEYIVCNDRNNSGITITHKGNCKFCVERNKNNENE